MFAMVLISSSSHPASVFVCVHVGECVCVRVCVGRQQCRRLLKCEIV